MEPALAVEGLGFSYPARANVLEDISFGVSAGEAVAVIGPSGAGKSTLFRIIAHLAAPAAGRIVLGGEDIYGASSRRRLRGAIGYVHQQHGLPVGIAASMAVLGGEMHRWSVWRLLTSALIGPGETDLARVSEVLCRVGLGGRESDRVGEMSVGQRQRVAVARTLLQAPRVIVADEPVASVDSATADVVLGLLAEEAARGAIVLCSVHDVGKARRHFPRIIGLDRGRLTFDGPREDLPDEVAAGVRDRDVA
ncbi:MAG: phosphonate ABC transporter [Coriobacteriaceae bacterium]|nr:phosphonate ABC transporter [Coriobacteriaceae bacterium]